MNVDVQPKLPPRIESLRDEVMKEGGAFPTEMNPLLPNVALWKAVQRMRSRVEVRAAFLREQIDLAPIEIRKEWNLAGRHLPHTRVGFEDSDPGDPQVRWQLSELDVDPDEAPEVREAVLGWRALGGTMGDYYEAEERAGQDRAGRGYFKRGRGTVLSSDVVYVDRSWTENHSVRDYAKVLRVGFNGIRREVERRLGDAEISDPAFPRRERFWRAALEVCDAGVLLGRRYAEKAAELAEDADDEEDMVRLRRMAKTCRRVPADGARSFFEAVQSLWLSHVLTCGEDGINANSIERLDQILFPYYEADLKAGRLTRHEALHIMEELACRLYLHYDVQAVTLGGVDAAGDCAVNDLSYLILEATRNVGFVRDLSVRVNRQTPEAFLELAAALTARGGGIPFFFNDECFVPALTERGLALEDARDYALIGCVELTIPGRANPHAVSGWFNAAKCLELALFDGTDPATGARVGPDTGMLTDFKSFEDFYAAYLRQVEHFAPLMVYHCNRGELQQREFGPLPCWSVLSDDCIGRGRDITDGGAAYNYHSICFIGTANVADSLVGLKRLVFEEEGVPAAELLSALRTDYRGREALRQRLLHAAPKYGNDVAEVDELARAATEHFIGLMDEQRSPLHGRYFVHLFSFLKNVDFGRSVGALPDGRRAGRPLAYSLSAHQGRDQRGITAMLNSLARLPHSRAAGGSAAIIELDPVFVQGAQGARNLAGLLRTSVEIGAGQTQWNVVSAERLRKAQDDPELYGDVPVRVAGYGQMFRMIAKDLQDHIIARTKHRN